MKIVNVPVECVMLFSAKGTVVFTVRKTVFGRTMQNRKRKDAASNVEKVFLLIIVLLLQCVYTVLK